MTPRLLLATALLAAPATLHAQGACAPGRLALVLSGGGAKGLAHAGAIAALEARGIRPDLVVGTSMGAVVGALYASGHDARALDSLARVIPLAEAFRGYQPDPPAVFSDRPALLVWAEEDGRLELQASAVKVPLVNRLLATELLAANLAAAGDFDRLPIPFRAVAADFLADTAVVFRGGDLAAAVRASSAIPIVFPPVEQRGRVLVDGGLVANVPIAIARAEGAERVIVVDVTDPPRDSLDSGSPIAVTAQLVDLVTRQPLAPLGPGDLYVRPDIGDFPPLDFRRSRVDSLLLLGRRAAEAALEAHSCGFPAGRPAPPPVIPAALRVGAVRVEGLPAEEGARLARGLRLVPGTTLPLDTLRARLGIVMEREALRALWIVSDGADPIGFSVQVRPPARRRAVLGAAFDADLGGRVWAGVMDRALVSPAWEGSLALAIGGDRLSLDAGIRRRFPVSRLVPTLSLGFARERVEFFDGDLAAADAIGRLGSAFVGLQVLLPGGWSASAGAEAIVWDDTGRATYGTGGATARLLRLGAPGERLLDARFTATPEWSLARGAVAFRGTWGAFRFRPVARAGWGDGIPLGLTEPLGGWHGFPGLPMGDRRAERELYAAVTASVRVLGPASAVGEIAAGRARPLAGSHHPDEVIAGARIGLGMTTRFGPVAVAWGRNDEGGEQWVVRVGEWF
ncbi:MAG TPA: patatin-like phospholipase family protein [Gemmatimonadales bacterium]|nr:patatin-like phospholipase family protein [Gemmatimonadales bacterium]